MTNHIWTVLTGADDVQVFYDEKSAESAAMQSVIDAEPSGQYDFGEKYGDPDYQITLENWRQVLEDLNQAQKDAGEAGYNAVVKKHEIPPAKLVVVLDDANAAIDGIATDSPFLAGIEAAIIKTGYDDRDYDRSDVFQVDLPGLAEGDVVGHRTEIELLPLDAAFEALDGKGSSVPSP